MNDPARSSASLASRDDFNMSGKTEDRVRAARQSILIKKSIIKAKLSMATRKLYQEENALAQMEGLPQFEEDHGEMFKDLTARTFVSTGKSNNLVSMIMSYDSKICVGITC